MADYINFLSGALQINTVSCYELKRVGICFCRIFCQKRGCRKRPSDLCGRTRFRKGVVSRGMGLIQTQGSAPFALGCLCFRFEGWYVGRL